MDWARAKLTVHNSTRADMSVWSVVCCQFSARRRGRSAGKRTLWCDAAVKRARARMLQLPEPPWVRRNFVSFVFVLTPTFVTKQKVGSPATGRQNYFQSSLCLYICDRSSLRLNTSLSGSRKKFAENNKKNDTFTKFSDNKICSFLFSTSRQHS